MESTADYDEQSEVLFLFNEDPEELPSQTPRCSLNQIQFPQPRNLHHQPPPISRQTNRFGPKYTPSNHRMP